MRHVSVFMGVVAAICTFAGHSASADDIADKVQICAGCHGENGIPQEKTTPIIWGQNEGYLYIELRDFKRGARKNDLMSPIAADLSKDEMKALAKHFAGLKWPGLQQPSPSKDVTKKALTVIGSIGCTSCHLETISGRQHDAAACGPATRVPCKDHG